MHDLSLGATATIRLLCLWCIEGSEGRVLAGCVGTTFSCQLNDAFLVLVEDDLTGFDERFLDIDRRLRTCLQEEQVVLLRESLAFLHTHSTLFFQITCTCPSSHMESKSEKVDRNVAAITLAFLPSFRPQASHSG